MDHPSEPPRQSQRICAGHNGRPCRARLEVGQVQCGDCMRLGRAENLTHLLADARDGVDRLLVGVDDVSSILTGVSEPGSDYAPLLPQTDDVDDGLQLLADVTRNLRGVRRVLAQVLLQHPLGRPLEQIAEAVVEWEAGDLAANDALAQIRSRLPAAVAVPGDSG